MKEPVKRVYDNTGFGVITKDEREPKPTLRKKIGWAKDNVKYLKRAIARVKRQEKRLEKLTEEAARLDLEYRRITGVDSEY